MARAIRATSSRVRMPPSTRRSVRARTRSSAPSSLLGMGLLDDAIREHLELKRAHGADPSEVAQLEREAFGPARRGPEPLEVPPAPTEPEMEPEPALEAVPEAPPEPEPVDPVLIEPEVDPPVYEPPAEPVEPAVTSPRPDAESTPAPPETGSAPQPEAEE